MSSFTIEENEGIRKFLDGNNKYIPTQELIYLHSHPLVRPNFLTQIDDLVRSVGEKIIAKGITGKPIEDLSSIFIRIGRQLPDITEDNAEEIVMALRDLYTLSIGLDKNL